MTCNAELAWAMLSGPVSSPSQNSLDDERKLCLSTAFEAGRICLAAPRVCARVKTDTSPVSAADIAIQAVVTRALREKFPNDGLIAEEETQMILSDPSLVHAAQKLVRFNLRNALAISESAKDADRFWTLDPIDGTKGFLSSSGYAVGLALMETEQGGAYQYPSLAALTLPHANTILLAETTKPRLLEFSLQSSIDEATESPSIYSARCAEHVDIAATAANPAESFVWLLSGADDLLLTGRPPWTFLCCGSLVKYAAVARQEACAFVQVLGNKRANVWDHAAGVAVVIAAGGSVTDEWEKPVAIGSTLHRQDLRLYGDAKAVVATAQCTNHASFCAEVRAALRAKTSLT